MSAWAGAASFPARADSLLTGTGTGSQGFSSPGGTYGYAFTVGENAMVVAGLGVTIPNMDVWPIISLWDYNGPLLGTIDTYLNFGNATSAGDFVQFPLPRRVRLEPGQTYVLAIRPRGQLGGSSLTRNQIEAVFAPAAGYAGALEQMPDQGLVPVLPTQPVTRAWAVSTLFFDPLPPLPPGGGLLNISARSRVGIGDDVSIAGFIVSGTASKRVIVRGMGPSLANYGVSGVLANPTLRLVDSSGRVLMTNDDWRDSQPDEIIAAGLAPGDPRESALIADLAPGSYTVILSGVAGGTGVGLIEAYDLAPETSASARPINLSARARVQTGDNVLIGGLILRGTNPRRILVRAVGSDLASFGVNGPLDDPMLAIYDIHGTRIAGNDDWQSDQAAEIAATGLAPSDDRDSALILTLPPGEYTAIVSGKSGAQGVAILEAFDLGE